MVIIMIVMVRHSITTSALVHVFQARWVVLAAWRCMTVGIGLHAAAPQRQHRDRGGAPPCCLSLTSSAIWNAACVHPCPIAMKMIFETHFTH